MNTSRFKKLSIDTRGDPWGEANSALRAGGAAAQAGHCYLLATHPDLGDVWDSGDWGLVSRVLGQALRTPLAALLFLTLWRDEEDRVPLTAQAKRGLRRAARTWTPEQILEEPIAGVPWTMRDFVNFVRPKPVDEAQSHAFHQVVTS